MSDFSPTPAPQNLPEEPQVEAETAPPPDPHAEAADRDGFRFLAVGFAIFFVIIAICAGVVALVMKNMGI